MPNLLRSAMESYLEGKRPPGEWTFYGYRTAGAPAGVIPPAPEPLGPVQVAGFNATWELSGWGNGEAIIPIEGNAVSRDDLVNGMYQWVLWASYAGEPVWAGLPTDLDDDGGAAVSVAFCDLPSYLHKCMYATSHRYNQVEQVTIARDLAARLSWISVPIVTDPGPGFLRDRSYEFLENTRADLLQNLSQVISGPAFRPECYTRAADLRPECRLKIGYPGVGQPTGLGLAVPGGAATFRVHWTAERMRTRTFAAGELPEDAPDGARRPVQMVDRPQPRVPGSLDEVDDYPGVILLSTLADRANANATLYAGPSMALDAVQPLHDPPIGTYGVGDPVNVALADTLIPDPLITRGTLTHLAVNAADGTAQWTISVSDPAPRPTTGLTARLRAVEAQTTGQFRHNLQTLNVGSIT